MAYYKDYSKFGNHIAAIQSDGAQITYMALSDVSVEIAKSLKRRSVVMSFCSNQIGSLCGYVSFLEHDIVPILLDRHINAELRERLLQIYQPDYIYAPEEMSQFFSDLTILWKGWGYVLLKTKYDYAHDLYPELGLLLSTSGSTGSPKLVRQSYQNIQANAESIAKYLLLNAEERPITTLPMNYTYGLSIINSHLLMGATILMTEYTYFQREFWSFFRQEKATSFGGVPYHYEILKKLRFFCMDLPSLHYMTQAGGKLTPELHQEFAEYAQNQNKKFIVMYGQTEATARMAYLPAEKALDKYGSMGIAIPGGRLELVDVSGETISEPDVVGEMVYYGANVTLGYAECAADLKLGDERQGRLETGDMAKRDAEGYYYIVGRKKRFLKIFGNRVNLDEMERMVKKYLEEQYYTCAENEKKTAALIECACSGRDDKLFVYLTSGDSTLQENLHHFLAEKTNLHPSAFRVVFIEAIPKNEAGKILYSQLN